MPAPVNYLWVGPPAQGKYKGHDVIGPDMLRDHCQQQEIIFWCLDDYVDHYTKYFEGKNVVVKSIQEYVGPRHSDLAEFIKEMQSRTYSEIAFKRRDYVTIKAAVQYFLQIEQWGYFLDTNIIPSPDAEHIPLPELKKFSYPDLGSQVDPWGMYAPLGDKNARKRFEYYFKKARSALKENPEKCVDLDAYYGLLGRAFIDAARNDSDGERLKTKKKCKIGTALDLLVAGKPVLRKRYYNSHYQHSVNINILFCIMMTENCANELRYQIDVLGIDVNAPFSLDGQASTVAHEAVLHDRPEALQVIISKVRDLDQAVIFNLGRKPLTLLELAQFTEHKKCVKIILLEKLQRLRDSQGIDASEALQTIMVLWKAILDGTTRVTPSFLRSTIKEFSSLEDLMNFASKQDLNSNICQAICVFLKLGKLEEKNADAYLGELHQVAYHKSVFFKKTTRPFERGGIFSQTLGTGKRTESIRKKIRAYLDQAKSVGKYDPSF